MEKTEKLVTAKLRYLNISPRKVRPLARVLKNLPVEEAKAYLNLSPKRAAQPLLKLLHSAQSNAAKNFKLAPEKLFIKDIRVDQGPVSKRFWPRARGTVNLIQRKTSHIFLTLAPSEKITPRFTFLAKPKKEKEALKKKKEKTKKVEEKEVISPTPKQKPGFFKKFFRRKAI